MCWEGLDGLGWVGLSVNFGRVSKRRYSRMRLFGMPLQVTFRDYGLQLQGLKVFTCPSLSPSLVTIPPNLDMAVARFTISDSDSDGKIWSYTIPSSAPLSICNVCCSDQGRCRYHIYIMPLKFLVCLSPVDPYILVSRCSSRTRQNMAYKVCYVFVVIPVHDFLKDCRIWAIKSRNPNSIPSNMVVLQIFTRENGLILHQAKSRKWVVEFSYRRSRLEYGQSGCYQSVTGSAHTNGWDEGNLFKSSILGFLSTK